MTDHRSAAAGNAAAATAYNLVYVPGDGIGPEVIAAGRRVLEGAARIFGFGFNWREIHIGGVAIDAYGIPMRDEDLAACADAAFIDPAILANGRRVGSPAEILALYETAW